VILRPRFFHRFSTVPLSLGLTLVCVCLSVWLAAGLTVAFHAALWLTAAAVILECVIAEGAGRQLRKIHELGSFRLVTMIVAVAVGKDMAGLAAALAVLAGIQCGFAFAAAAVRLLRTRSRADLVTRIAERERAKRSRSFWFGRAPR
jgi:hypothetical protein